MTEIDSMINEIAKKLEEKANNIQQSDKSAGNAITDQNIQQVLSNNRVVVVDFWAPWCAPCHLYEPIFEKIAQKYKDKAFFGRLNVDENPKTADEYSVLNIPTTLIFVNGEVKETLIGAIDSDTLENAIKKYV